MRVAVVKVFLAFLLVFGVSGPMLAGQTALAEAPVAACSFFAGGPAGDARKADSRQHDRDRRGADLGRQCVDAGLRGTGADDERPRTGTVLWRSGAEEECSGHHDADLRHDGHGDGAVGPGELLAGLWSGKLRLSAAFTTPFFTV